ncbi:MAG: hypothetical protein ACREPQ_06765 [Rhodanobacter sp.]
MEQGGLTVMGPTPSISQLSRVHEVLNRERRLTIEMIRNLHRSPDISAKSLIMA